MKKLIIVVFIVSIFCLTGCLDNYIPIEEYNSKVEQLEEANREILDEYKILVEDNNNLKNKVNTLENDLDLSNEEIDKQLIDYGQIMKGNSEGKPIYYLNFLKEELQSKPHPNVSIWNLIVNLNK